MRRRAVGLLTVILPLAFFFISTQASAVDLISAKDPKAILNIARGFGMAKLKKDIFGDPLIVGRINGTKYSIYFYNCRKNRNCKVIAFKAGWEGKKVSLEKINKWNKDNIFGTAYKVDEETVKLKLPVDLEYGVTEENLEDIFERWTSILKDFESEVLGVR